MNWLPGIPSVSSDGSIGRIGEVLGTLDQRRHEAAEHHVHARVRAGEEVVGDEAGQRQDVGEGRAIAEGREVGLDGDAGAAHGVAALAPDGDQGEVVGLVDDVAGHEPHDVGVQRTGQRAVRRDEHDQALAALRGRQQRVVLAAEDRREVGQDLIELLAVGPRRERRVLGALELRRGHELHRPRDLLDVLHGADPAPDVALASHRCSLRRHRRSNASRARRRRACELSALQRASSGHAQRANAAMGRSSAGQARKLSRKASVASSSFLASSSERALVSPSSLRMSGRSVSRKR